ncbi:MAG: MFS transporter [Candidatus Levybacteria bacterium]|nr:MFS transporter [Candidatus Levybacteria bacterium]
MLWFLGIFSDYIGRKKTMILGAICSVLSVTFYAVGASYFVLFIGALFEGLQRAWYSGNNDALLYETLSNSNRKDDYDHYLGKTSAMFQVATAVGIIVGGFIAVWSFPLVMWLSVIPQVICFIISLLIAEPSRQSNQSSNIYSHLMTATKKIWTNRKLRLLSTNSIIGFAIGESTYQFRAAFVNTLWPLWAVGFSKVLSSIGAAISYWYSGKLIKKGGAFRLLLISGIYGKIINIISVAIATVISPVLLSSTSLFYGVTEVANSKLMQKEFTDEQRATLGSLNSFMGNLAFGVFAIILGIFADKFGPTKALLFAYLFSLPTLLINWTLFKSNKNE